MSHYPLPEWVQDRLNLGTNVTLARLPFELSKNLAYVLGSLEKETFIESLIELFNKYFVDNNDFIVKKDPSELIHEVTLVVDWLLTIPIDIAENKTFDYSDVNRQEVEYQLFSLLAAIKGQYGTYYETVLLDLDLIEPNTLVICYGKDSDAYQIERLVRMNGQ